MGRLRAALRSGRVPPLRCLLTVAGLLGAAWALGSATAHAQEPAVPNPGELVPAVSVSVELPEPLALGDAVDAARETTETVGAPRELTDTVTLTASEARDGATGAVWPAVEAVATAPVDPGVELLDPELPATPVTPDPGETSTESVPAPQPGSDGAERTRSAPRPSGEPAAEAAGPSVVAVAHQLAATEPSHAPAEWTAEAEPAAPLDGAAITGQAQQHAPTSGPLLAGHLSTGNDLAPDTGTHASRNGPVLVSTTASDEPSFSPD